jgi:hypothetical protein
MNKKLRKCLNDAIGAGNWGVKWEWPEQNGWTLHWIIIDDSEQQFAAIDMGKDGFEVLYRLPGNQIREVVTYMKMLLD